MLERSRWVVEGGGRVMVYRRLVGLQGLRVGTQRVDGGERALG